MGLNYREMGFFSNFRLSRQDAETVYSELLKISGQDGFTAEDVVEQAKDESSPLHKYFEWDDTKAAHQFRLQQARKLIKSVMVEVQIEVSPTTKVTNHVIEVQKLAASINKPPSIQPQPEIITARIEAVVHERQFSEGFRLTNGPGRYKPYAEVLQHPIESENVVDRAWKDLKSWHKKYKEKINVYGTYAEMYAPVLRDIEELERKMEERAVTEIAAAGQR